MSSSQLSLFSPRFWTVLLVVADVLPSGMGVFLDCLLGFFLDYLLTFVVASGRGTS